MLSPCVKACTMNGHTVPNDRSWCVHRLWAEAVVCRTDWQRTSRLLLKCDGAHAKTRIRFWWNGPVHLNRRRRQFSRLLAAEACTSAVVMLDTPCTEVVWRVLATHCILQFPLHLPSRASPCAITFQLESNNLLHCIVYLLFNSPTCFALT